MDEAVLLWVNHAWAHPFTDTFFTWVSSRPYFSYPLLVLLLLHGLRQAGVQGLRFWLFLVVAVVLGDALGAQLKALFAEPRPCALTHLPLRAAFEGRLPCGDNLTGMPSNHALNFFLAATLVWRATPWRGWQLALVGIAVAVGLSRIYLGKHFPSQVLGGAVLGVFLGVFAAWLACRWRACIPRRENACMADPRAEAVTRLPPGPVPAHTLSLVIPLYNEADNVAPLITDVGAALQGYPWPWEVILVDDGSTDATAQRLREVSAAHGARFRVLRLQRNYGQTAAMQAGIDAARGTVIATLDGDLQNDPADIPAMAARLLRDELDLLAGWRRRRQDNVWLRTIPSRIANALIGRVTGVRLHDYGCSLKVYRADLLKDVRLYGEMHRFIPAWISAHSAPERIQEQVVNHRPRVHGTSKYGIGRVFRVLLDLLSVYFFLRFLPRPGHFFGRIGLVFGLLGGTILLYLSGIKLFLGESIGDRPLLLAGVLLVLVAVQFLTTGVLSELTARTYFASTAGKPYLVRHDSRPQPSADDDWPPPPARRS